MKQGAAEPTRLHVEDRLLADLRERLARARWPGQIAETGWQRGPDERYMRGLADRWRDYDWRSVEARLNELPHFRASLDGVQLHFVHLRSADDGALPLLLTHGWPSTFCEFVKVAPLLVGSSAGETAFHLVIPSLPGYGFSRRLQPPRTFNDVPQLWHVADRSQRAISIRGRRRCHPAGRQPWRARRRATPRG